LMMLKPVLLDHDSNPTVRDTILHLMMSSQTADLAIANVRLGAIDLTGSTMGPGHFRLLVANLDFGSLEVAVAGVHDRARLRLLLGFAMSGRLEVRRAASSRWCPDFSIYHGLPNGNADVALFGAHYFRALFAHGTALTSLLTEPPQLTHLANRFDELWNSAYDVLPVIIDSLRDAMHRASANDGAPGCALDPPAMAGT
jgi:hypothetical protein